MKLLIFGSTGQVAKELGIICEAEEINAIFLDRKSANLGEPNYCGQVVRQSDADIVINVAGYTAVDDAEDDPINAFLINADSPIEMARAAADFRKPFIHVSTDYVFPGDGTIALREEDMPAPTGIYGRSKLAGEVGIAQISSDYVILRTAWVFSAYGRNFAKTMRRLANERSELNIVDDQFGSPTPATDIAKALIHIARAFHAGKGASGVFHFAGSPAASWADFAEAIFAADGHMVTVNRVPSSQYPTRATRPAYSVLDCSKIKRHYGIEQPDWRKGLTSVLAKLESET